MVNAKKTQQKQRSCVETHASISNLDSRFGKAIKGIAEVEQRMSNFEYLLRWTIGLLITSWLTLAGLNLVILFKVL